MTVSFKERITRGLDTFAEGMWPVINDAMTKRSAMGGNWTETYPGENLQSDAAAQIGVILDNRAQIFRYVLQREEFSWIHEVKDWRNKVSHGGQVGHADAFRALDTIERVLTRHAPDAAGQVLAMKESLLTEQAHKQALKAKPKADDLFSGEVAGLKPWREVVQPHPDVAAGRFAAAEFAADLFMVHNGQGSQEYVDPVAFFQRTYLTDGLEKLLKRSIRRINGDDGSPPVVDLQTTFGGGKTHSMISLYHLFAGVPTKDLPQEMQDLLESENVSSLPKVNRAVVVGTRLVPAQADDKPDGCSVGTIWGEIAWQLGGKEAYEYIRASDESRTSPGDRIRKVIEDAAPCVILIDEWVSYAAQLLGEDDLRAGDFDTQFYFAQTLTEVVKNVKGALLVVSLPASVDSGGHEVQVQVSGEDAHTALRKLRDAVGRTKDAWTPATAHEGFEIVRRRLFQTPDAENLKYIKATAKSFSEFYGKQAAEFPPEAREAEYARMIERSFPIHPELFTRLYDDWSTLERFQRTRGVLRLMAQVIHALWSENDRSPMIMPGLLPLDDPTVANEIVSNLNESWPPILHRDVDGEDSTPRAIDLQYPNLNQYAATRRVARTVMLGSAPSLNSANRGIDIQRVRLGAVMPGEQVAVFNDALAKLVARATYLYHEGSRYWYGTQAHVGQLARDRAEQLRTGRTDLIEEEIRRRLTAMSSPRGDFAAVHVMPASPSEVADADEARLVILGPETSHQGRSTSEATSAALSILEQRGNAPRLYRNMLTFLAPEQKHVDSLLDAAAAFLAWDQLDSEKVAPLNLDPLNQKQVEDRLVESNARLDAAVREAYKIALAPLQSDPAAEVEFEVIRCDGAEPLASRTSKKFVNQGILNATYSTEMLRSLLDGVLAPLWEHGHCTVKDLWDVFARYTYLPRLKDADALASVLSEGAARVGWERSTWALAAGVTSDGTYVGLVGGALSGTINGTWLIVKPEIAEPLINLEPEPGPGPEPIVDPDPVPPPTGPTRFWGRKNLNPAAAQLRRDFEQVESEVIALLQRELGSEVKVTINIEVVNEGEFSESVVRNVKANADTLRFDDHGFA